MKRRKYVVVGAGRTGIQAASTLRQIDPSGVIHLLGDEPEAPYQRPPLSTTFLTGETEPEQLYLESEEFYRSAGLELWLGDPVLRIDRPGQKVVTAKGRSFDYDRLLLATGATPRRLPLRGAEAQGVFYLRTLGDAMKIRTHLTGRNRAVILGGGYIGMEVASAIRQKCESLTVVEQAERILQRVASKIVSRYLEELHAHAGVDLRLSASISEILHNDGAITGVLLTAGELIPCDTIILAGGATPETRLALECGLQVDNGVLVDAGARTSDEKIWAAGDCANFPSRRYGRRMRLESEPHAIDHANVAASNMAGDAVDYDPVPWFWSEQYEARLQIVGLPGQAGLQVLRGTPESGRFSVWHLAEDKVLAAECMNDARTFNVARKLVKAGSSVDPSRIMDTGYDLRGLVD